MVCNGQRSSISEQELVRCSGPLFSGLFSGLFQAQMKAAAAGKGGPVAEMPWDDPVEVHRISSCCFSCVNQQQQGVKRSNWTDSFILYGKRSNKCAYMPQYLNSSDIELSKTLVRISLMMY